MWCELGSSEKLVEAGAREAQLCARRQQAHPLVLGQVGGAMLLVHQLRGGPATVWEGGCNRVGGGLQPCGMGHGLACIEACMEVARLPSLVRVSSTEDESPTDASTSLVPGT